MGNYLEPLHETANILSTQNNRIVNDATVDDTLEKYWPIDG